MEVVTETNQPHFGFLEQVYGKGAKPQLQQILLQLDIVHRAYPGLNMDLFDYMHRQKKGDKSIIMKKKGIPLVKLCSLIQAPNTMVHSLDSEVQIPKEPVFLRKVTTKKQMIDLTFSTNALQTSQIPSDDTPIKWETDDLKEFEKLAYQMTVNASPATLCLFVNKGISQPMFLPGEHGYDRDFCMNNMCLSLFTQPPHNML
jgi:hypothetical protein